MVIGITGTDGAGKGAVVEYLVGQKGYVHYSARELITAEIKKRGLEADRETTRLVANSMRKELGDDVIVTTSLARIKADGSSHAVIESIRAMDEALTLKARGGVLLAVDADPTIRYKRISGRKSALDNVTFEVFLAQETLEMNDPDPNGMQKAKVMAMADFTIQNDGSFTELREQINLFLDKFHD